MTTKQQQQQQQQQQQHTHTHTQTRCRTVRYRGLQTVGYTRTGLWLASVGKHELRARKEVSPAFYYMTATGLSDQGSVSSKTQNDVDSK